MSAIRSKEMYLGPLSKSSFEPSAHAVCVKPEFAHLRENILMRTPFYGSEEGQTSESQNFGFSFPHNAVLPAVL